MNRAGQVPQPPDARLPFVDAAPKDANAVPVGREHGSGRAPQLLAAAPGSVAADEDHIHLRYSDDIRRDLIDLIRADEWWDYKLVPILSVFYATTLVLGGSLISRWTAAMSLVLSIVPAAAYTSVINDLTDQADDGAAGKRNRVAGRSRQMVLALLALTVGAGCVFAWLWRDDWRLQSFYVAIWLAFSLYSLPPLRLKKHGVAGVLCDAAGAHLFPALVAVFIADRGTHRTVSAAWLTAVAIWSLTYGLRGILWHQLSDAKNDLAANVRTFARQYPTGAGVAGTFVVFPLELGALAALLWQIGSVWPAAFLVLYVLYAIRSARRWHTQPVIVRPKPRFFIVLHQFYSDLFPLALLIAAVLRDWHDLIVLVVHVSLFPRLTLQAIRRLSASTAKTVVNASDPNQGGFG
jgi:hypothetical protein